MKVLGGEGRIGTRSIKQKAKLLIYYVCVLILQHEILCQKVLYLYLLQDESPGTRCPTFAIVQNRCCWSVSWLGSLCPLSSLQGREVMSLFYRCKLYHFTLISILIMAVAIDKGITFWHFLPEMEGMQ